MALSRLLPVDYFAIFTALLFSSLFMRQTYAEDTPKSEAETYLREYSDQNADSNWERAFHRRAAEAMRDNESIVDEERYADDKALEFFFDKKKHFEDSSANPLLVKDKIEVARWYLLFFNNGWRIPSQIAAHMTKSNYERYTTLK